jgi:hypothetical protein
MTTLYQARCHCGSVRFSFKSEPITAGRRCNCSICVRKGDVVSARYYAPEEFGEISGADALGVYQFGDRDMKHCFCRTCGIHPFSVVASVPPDYQGAARPGYRRVNLGCVEDLDVFSLDIEVLDGKSL